MNAPVAKPRRTSAGALLAVWLVIVALGVFSLAMRFAHIGGFSFLVGFLVAAVQVSLLGLYFMELVHEPATVRLAFLTCLTLLFIFIALVMADVLTRPVPPLMNPPGTAQRYRG